VRGLNYQRERNFSCGERRQLAIELVFDRRGEKRYSAVYARIGKNITHGRQTFLETAGKCISTAGRWSGFRLFETIGLYFVFAAN